VQVNQAVNQVLSTTVPLPAAAMAMMIPMQWDLSINAQTRDGECRQQLLLLIRERPALKTVMMA
jgi:hypothetical protein